MKKRIADKWVKALRSGEYKQGRNRLASCYGAFCCLGVLCELAIKSGVDINKTKNENAEILYDGCRLTLPKAVVDWAGVQGSSPMVTNSKKKSRYLETINDQSTSSFKKIANIIEKNYKQL